MLQDADRIYQIERPDPKLWTYYLLSSLLAGPFFLVALLPLYFRYKTLHYRFDREGISMGWGILFRREIHLTYSRVQDIHLVANFVERWLGLARIQIQTASGSAKAEMTLEGLLEFELLRDFLYSRMRGARDVAREGSPPAASPELQPHESSDVGGAPALVADASSPVSNSGGDDLTAVLAEVARELRAVRLALEASRRSETE